MTVVARPPAAVRSLLEGWMHEALGFAGPGHFLTGRRDSVHLTVRALEPYRETAAPTDRIVGAWQAALARTAAASDPLELCVTGITLSPVGVLAQLEPADEGPWELMDRLRDELGAEAWFEDQWGKRDIWYATLLHFAADIENPEGLVDWVSRHRQVEPVDFTVDEIELVRSRYTTLAGHNDAPAEQYMRPETWVTVPLGSRDSLALESEPTPRTERG